MTDPKQREMKVLFEFPKGEEIWDYWAQATGARTCVVVLTNERILCVTCNETFARRSEAANTPDKSPIEMALKAMGMLEAHYAQAGNVQ